MKIKYIFAVAIIASVFTLSVFAQEQPAAKPQEKPKTPIVKEKMVNQHARIRQGVKSGELTKAEAAKLRNEQKNIREDIKEAKADGKVTKQERKQIKKEQKKASRDIVRLKHNERKRK